MTVVYRMLTKRRRMHFSGEDKAESYLMNIGYSRYDTLSLRQEVAHRAFQRNRKNSGCH